MNNHFNEQELLYSGAEMSTAVFKTATADVTATLFFTGQFSGETKGGTSYKPDKIH